MDQRGLKVVVAMGLLAAASACASGDGVPTATIENGLDTCIVEASFLEYGFADPIGPSGRMASREVTVGSDVAYAVVMTPAAGETCESLASRTGGTLWVTKARYSAEAGNLTRIRFAADTANPVDCGAPAYQEGIKRFARLSCSDAAPPQDAAAE